MAGSTIWAPRGDKGPDGDQGPPGPEGPQGPQGGPGPDAATFLAYKNLLSSSAGSDNIGYGPGTVTTKFAELDVSINALTLAVDSGSNYTPISISAGAVTLNTQAYKTFDITLTQNITSMTLSNAVAGSRRRITIIFRQDATSAKTVVFPSSVKLPVGISNLVSSTLNSVSIVNLLSVDGGVTWYAVQESTYSGATSFSFPPITTENTTFLDEGTSTSGWTMTGATIASTGRTVITKSTAAGTLGKGEKPITMPASNKDYSIICSAKVRNAATSAVGIVLTNGTAEFSIWFNSATAGDTQVAGAMSISSFTSSRNYVAITPGVDFGTTDFMFELAYDSTFGTTTLYFRETNGTWSYKGRVNHTWFSAPNITVFFPTATTAGAFLDFDYLMIARPNIIAIGDSITAGSTLFDPNPSLSLVNYDSTWMRYMKLYQTLRNNRVINKGVGGNTSAQMSARLSADVITQLPQLLIIVASSNDEVNGVSQATRTSTIQGMVNVAVTATIKVVLANGLYGVAGSPNNTTPRDLKGYNTTWWNSFEPTITGLSAAINSMVPLLISTGTGYQDPALSQSDGLHPNIAGYTAMGNYYNTGA